MLTWSELRSNGFLTDETDTAFMGQAKAGITLTENASTIINMPAALIRLPAGTHGLIGVTSYSSQFTHEDNDIISNTTHKTEYAGHAYVSWNGTLWGKQLALGLGQHFPFNAKLSWENDWPGRHIITDQTLHVGFTSLVSALAVNDLLSVGAGVFWAEAILHIDRNLILNDSTDIPAKLGVIGQNRGFIVSAYIHQEQFSYGFNFKSKIKIPLQGTIQFDTQKTPSVTGKFPDGDVSIDFYLPSLMTFGFAYKEKKDNPNWLIELSFIQAGWVTFSELEIDFASNKPSETEIIKKDWRDTIGIKLGGYYKVLSYLKIRSGIAYDQTPIPEDTLDPSAPLGDKITWAIGTGWDFNKILIDLAYQFLYFQPINTTTNPYLNGEYNGSAHIFSSSIGVNF